MLLSKRETIACEIKASAASELKIYAPLTCKAEMKDDYSFIFSSTWSRRGENVELRASYELSCAWNRKTRSNKQEETSEDIKESTIHHNTIVPSVIGE